MSNWNETLDINHILRDEDMEFEEKRDAIVAKVKASRWYKKEEEAGFVTLYLIIEEMQDADDVDWFDSTLSALYDEADADRIWMGA